MQNSCRNVEDKAVRDEETKRIGDLLIFGRKMESVAGQSSGGLRVTFGNISINGFSQSERLD